MRAIERRLDVPFSRWIRNRDWHRCVLCGSTTKPECGHLLPRFARSTRWDKDNAACLCHWCNARHEEEPGLFVNWWKERHGVTEYDRLVRKHNKPYHFSMTELEELLESLCAG